MIIERLLKRLGYVRASSASERLRRWEAAATDRLNAHHWSTPAAETLNTDLASWLEPLRNRCAYEAANNPLYEGIIQTHVVDVVGPEGPTLQVQAASTEYAEALEAGWRAWWAAPDATGQLSGTDLLSLWIRQLWLCGEYLAQIIVDPTADGAVQERLLALHPARLGNPFGLLESEGVTLGVRRTSSGKPTAYYVSRTDGSGALAGAGTYDQIPAEQILHGYKILEAGQVRGVPWLASALQIIADLRDYDHQVLDAARMAADWAVLASTKHPDLAPLVVNETTEIERRTIKFLPPGYEAGGLMPPQPSTNYVEYRKERQRDIARGVAMPLMTVRLDSSGHNYSSARFDGQTYQRTLRAFQGWLARQALNRLVALVARRLELAGQLGKPGGPVHCGWVWPVPPHVDPLKEAQATDLKLRNGTITYADALAAEGRDEDAVIEGRRRTKEKLAAAGLPAIAEPQGAGRYDGDLKDGESENDNGKGSGALGGRLAELGQA